MALYDFQIGLSAGSLDNLEDLGLPAPKPTYKPYSQFLRLGDGTVRGGGWPTAAWEFGFLTQAQRDTLRAYCPAASAAVYIRTQTRDSADAYATFAAIMLWPAEEEVAAGRRLNFTIQFQRLVAV